MTNEGPDLSVERLCDALEDEVDRLRSNASLLEAHLDRVHAAVARYIKSAYGEDGWRDSPLFEALSYLGESAISAERGWAKERHTLEQARGEIARWERAAALAMGAMGAAGEVTPEALESCVESFHHKAGKP